MLAQWEGACRPGPPERLASRLSLEIRIRQHKRAVEQIELRRDGRRRSPQTIPRCSGSEKVETAQEERDKKRGSEKQSDSPITLRRWERPKQRRRFLKESPGIRRPGSRGLFVLSRIRSSIFIRLKCPSSWCMLLPLSCWVSRPHPKNQTKAATLRTL